MKLLSYWLLAISLIAIVLSSQASASGVRIKDIARVKGVRENALVGYGVVVGLAGTGDSSRNKSTVQSIANTLVRFGITVSPEDIKSRNVASVMITAKLPAFSETGDTFDVNVSSMGDAKSLVGGTLLLTPLTAANGNTYALAQGQISVGGYKFDSFGNVVQKNHPTVGLVPKGATVEKETLTTVFQDGSLQLVLAEPDFTTVDRIVTSLNQKLSDVHVEAKSAGKVTVTPNYEITNNQLARLIAHIENVEVTPDINARVVINERTGTVVSGDNVKISAVSIAHGSIKLQIENRYEVSQPTLLFRPSDAVRTTIVPETQINATEQETSTVSLQSGTTVTELVQALKTLKLSTRDIITILQSIKQAGALHAELIIQ